MFGFLINQFNDFIRFGLEFALRSIFRPTVANLGFIHLLNEIWMLFLCLYIFYSRLKTLNRDLRPFHSVLIDLAKLFVQFRMENNFLAVVHIEI